MSGDGKRSVAEWPKLPRPSSTLPKAKVWLWNQSFADKDVFTEQWLDMKDGTIVPEFDGQKLSRISVIERYPASGSRKILNAYIVGYNIKSGAIGMNMAAPSQHIGVIASTVDDLYVAATELDKHIGAYMTIEAGQVKAVLDLPIYSMMTTLPARDILDRQSELAASGTNLGYTDGMPWYRKMSYLFFSLDRNRKIH
jgi:adenine deaminase